MSKVTIHVESNLQWKAIHSESGVWVAACEPLGVTMEADTLDELYEVIGESCSVLFLDLYEDDQLDSFLRSRGWSASDLPESTSGKPVEFEVPWNLVAEGGLRGAA